MQMSATQIRFEKFDEIIDAKICNINNLNKIGRNRYKN